MSSYWTRLVKTIFKIAFSWFYLTSSLFVYYNRCNWSQAKITHLIPRQNVTTDAVVKNDKTKSTASIYGLAWLAIAQK